MNKAEKEWRRANLRRMKIAKMKRRGLAPGQARRFKAQSREGDSLRARTMRWKDTVLPDVPWKLPWKSLPVEAYADMLESVQKGRGLFEQALSKEVMVPEDAALVVIVARRMRAVYEKHGHELPVPADPPVPEEFVARTAEKFGI